jgi:hypothetical protein
MAIPDFFQGFFRIFDSINFTVPNSRITFRAFQIAFHELFFFF